MNPKSKDNVFEQLKIDEGIKHECYLCSENVPTFGVGHKILESDIEYGMPVGTEVSEERIWEVFQDDLAIAISECEVLFTAPTWSKFPDEVQEVCVNMMFNLGRPRYSKFTKHLAALEAHDWVEAGAEARDSRWHKQVGNRAERLCQKLEAL
jgi:lysozyme